MSDDAPVWAEPAAASGSTGSTSDPAPDDDTARSDRRAVVVDLDWRSVAVVMMLLVALGLGVGAVRHASVGVTLIVVALFLALALDPLVDRLQTLSFGDDARSPDGKRHPGRGASVLFVVLVVAAAFGIFVGLAGPQLVSQTKQLGTELPHTVDSMTDVPILGPHLRDWDVPKKVTEFLSSLPEKIGQSDANIGGVAKGVGFGLGAFVLGALVAVGALLDGPRLVGTVRSAIPVRHQARADDIGRIVYSVVGRYFAGSLLIALLNGIWVPVWALVAGAPLSPVLGVWAALTSLIPQIGGLMGFAVVVLVSLAAGLGPAAVMTVTFLFFMLLTNHILQPTIVGKAVELSAPVPMLAAITGFTIGGVVGALFAVPTVGAIKAVLAYMRDPDHELPARPEHHSRFTLERFRRWVQRRRGRADPLPTPS
jgi:predicted PurR-regulated permease PerM